MSLKNVFRFRESDRKSSSNSASADQERTVMMGSPLFQSLPSDMQEQAFLNLHLVLLREIKY